MRTGRWRAGPAVGSVSFTPPRGAGRAVPPSSRRSIEATGPGATVAAEPRPTHDPAGPARTSWPLMTIVWALLAFAVPLNDALPPALRTLWFLAIFGSTCASTVLRRVVRPLHPAAWIFAGYATLIGVLTATDQVAISDNLFVGAQMLVLVAFAPFVLTRHAVDDQHFVPRVSLAFLAGQTTSAVVAVLQLSNVPIHVPGAIYGAVFGRAAGLAEHPTTLGIMSCIAVLLSLRILIIAGRCRLLLLAVVAANVLSLVASGSLTSVVMGLATGLLVLVVCERERLGRVVGWGVRCAIVLALTVTITGVGQSLPSLPERYSEVTSPTERGSWNARLQTVGFAWNQIAAEPIFGEGLSPKARGSYDGATTVHNSILRGWYQGGVLLGAAYGAIFLGIFLVVVRSMLDRQYGSEASILAAILVYAMTSPLLEQRHLWLPILVCWASISYAESKKGAKVGRVTHQRLSPLLTIGRSALR